MTGTRRGAGAIPLVAVLVALAPSSSAAQNTERLYQEACDAGDMIACNVFGLMYETGEGVPRNLERAIELYRRACEGGAYVGCTNVGLMHQQGRGVPPSDAEALGFYRVACEGGELLGCDLFNALNPTMPVPFGERFYKSGRVADASNGRGLGDALVDLPELGLRLVTDANGRIEAGSLPRGSHLIIAERAGYERVEGRLEVPGQADFLILLEPRPLEELLAPGRIVGEVVDDDTGQALNDVEVSVGATNGRSTLSGGQGRFSLRDLEPGLVQVHFTRLGYAPRTAHLIVQAGRTSELSVGMATRPIELAAIEVTVRVPFLERNGFYDRANAGWGSRFDRAAMDEIEMVGVSDLVRRSPGVRLEVTRNGLVAMSNRSSSITRGPCPLGIYVDGFQMTAADMDMTNPDVLEAVEIYSAASTPVQYSHPCGVILMWTKR